MSGRGPCLFLSHGSGPMVLLGAEPFKPLVELLQSNRDILKNAQGRDPKAIILISAHWETDEITLTTLAEPGMFHDYDSEKVPKAVFDIKYPCKGCPELSRKITQKLDAAGLNYNLETERGFDHSVWVPLTLLRPQADIPVVQMSVLNNKDPEQHLKLGQALESLRDDGYAIIGSGSSFHNLPAVLSLFMEKKGDKLSSGNREFEVEMEKAVKIQDVDTRFTMLKNWRSFPNSEWVHPPNQEEHFMPFLVAAGAAGKDIPTKLPSWNLYGAEMSTYVW